MHQRLSLAKQSLPKICDVDIPYIVECLNYLKGKIPYQAFSNTREQKPIYATIVRLNRAHELSHCWQTDIPLWLGFMPCIHTECQ